MIAEYVVTVLKVTEYEEIMCMGREVFIDVMDECMGGVPKPLKTMTMCWYLEGLKLPAGRPVMSAPRLTQVSRPTERSRRRNSRPTRMRTGPFWSQTPMLSTRRRWL
jgi:hypothetical protein